MALKNLMVHLDQGARTAVRLELAVALARRHQARLVGVFAQCAAALQVGVVASWPTPEYAAAAAASQSQFAQAASGLADTEWHDVNRGSEGEILRHMTNLSRHTDLLLLGQHEEGGEVYAPGEMAEELVENSGRPVLIVPYAGSFAHIGKHPLIAWSDAREAARALNDALPLIDACDEAFILSFAEQRDEAEASCAQATRHLACHGIKARTEILPADGIGLMDMLLNRVADRDADLLVMGGHGHPGLAKLGRGAGTRHIFRHMTVPVLMSS